LGIDIWRAQMVGGMINERAQVVRKYFRVRVRHSAVVAAERAGITDFRAIDNETENFGFQADGAHCSIVGTVFAGILQDAVEFAGNFLDGFAGLLGGITLEFPDAFNGFPGRI
jgi:hypothetical protein